MSSPQSPPRRRSPPRRSPPAAERPPAERMWSLDLSILALAALILYLILTQLRFDDPRWQHNGWTYIAAVPLAALGLDLLLRRLASRYVQKSVQIGFLSSIIVHLLLLIVAVQWVIFPHYFSETHTGVKSQPSPVQKTVPEYLFRTPDSPGQTPDWSEPVAAAAPAPAAEAPARQPEAAERRAPERALPRPAEPEPPEPRENLQRRAAANPAPPQPADTSASRPRQRRDIAREAPLSEPPEAPAVAASPTPMAEPTAAERSAPQPERSPSRAAQGAAAPTDLPESPETPRSAALAERRRSDAMPRVGDPGAARRPRRAAGAASVPAGAAPAAPSVAISRRADSAEQLLTPQETPLPRRQRAGGAERSAGAMERPLPRRTEPSAGSAVAAIGDRARATANQQPEIAADSPQPGRRPRRQRESERLAPAGTPDASQAIAAATPGTPPHEQARGEPAPREDATRRERSRAVGAGADLSQLGPGPLEDASRPAAALELRRTERAAAVAAGGELPDLAELPPGSRRRAKRELGGPPTPAGTEVTAVDPFRRRTARTSGGAQPTPSGTVGPATEEAIERGLSWLAERQNEDGSWSLQGHGEEVVLTSDTAATGLSLLAFQGAGYTHRKHQYAGTVARGLEFLISSQRTNGDLYRRENPTSDRNVALYSHGIAALALCEAYGMTQDPELRGPAQASLDYIAATQHHRRGGWRYTPQVSADTSVTGWMMMALKSGELAGLDVPRETYTGIQRWLRLAQASPGDRDRYRYNPYAPDTPSQRHGRIPTPTMTSVGILMRMYLGWQRDNPAMQSAAEYLIKHPPQIGTERSPQRDTYYWYYATQVMFHMGGEHWDRWNRFLKPILLDAQIKRGSEAGSWHPDDPVPDRWGPHAGRLYVTTMNLLNLEIYYRHLPIYEKPLE